ncbi:MAG: NUDIX domain-containing protein [Acidobacteriota bacterium]|nr:NUDIX domain-containing protein [Acidobacteriota bacterium]MDE3043874.1 NUDIX domain-containing protein [Acidobacteriota bacterium]MDE3106939.1 NUDIX domain-containing protein [Acidobacteriota bacterium]
MADSAPPRPAATILVLRDRDQGFEVLMLRRNLRSDFVGGAYVFPGGGVDPGDASPRTHARILGLSDAQASRRLGLVSGGLAYYVASVRELFEEAGLLLACDASGQSVATSTALARALSHEREALNAGDLEFVDLLEREDLYVDATALRYLAHWVTPVGPPRRYDTRFFVARAPADQVAAHDQGETVAHRWLRPRDALEAHRRGEFEMIFPTVRNLEALIQFSRVDQVLEYAEGLDAIPRIEPQLVERGGVVVPVIEGEEGPSS